MNLEFKTAKEIYEKDNNKHEKETYEEYINSCEDGWCVYDCLKCKACYESYLIGFN